MGSRRRWAAPAVVALLAAGCGGAESEPPAAPQRVVSLSPTATETLFAIGAGEQVVAVDDQSDHPRHAPRTGIQPAQPNLEAIARYRPDLVVVSDTSPPDVAPGLRRLGITVLAQPSARDLGDAYDQIRALGAATGHPERAESVVARMRSRLARLFAAAAPDGGLSVYHELQPDLYAASSRTFIGRIYERLGLHNVADAAARTSGSDYPQLSPEYVVAADPDLIVLADTECCDQSPATVRRRAGWSEIAAVRAGDVIPVDTDLASRWGPRLPRFVARIVAGLRAR